MIAKRKLTLSITLVAALLMALLTAGSALASEGTEIEVVGTVVGWDIDASTIDIEVEIAETDPVETEILTVQVGQNFDFTTIAVGDILEVKGTLGEDGTLVLTELKIQDRIRDQIKLQDGEGDAYFCDPETDKIHPVAEKVALLYGYEYADILPYLCGENPVSLGQIMLALQTAALTGEDFTTYLVDDAFSWGKIWQEFDIKGKPDKGVPPGEIQKGDKDGDPEEKGDQGKKNQDEECDQLLCEVINWFQKGKNK